MGNFENLTVEIDGGIATVTVSRPKALNALNDATIGEIDRAFSTLASDDATRVVILTGAGEKAFVAGADISELADLDVDSARACAQKGQRAFAKIERLGKPVIAAINGFALGGGLELALSCHLRWASTAAKLGLPEVKLALIPGYGGTQRLQQLVGQGAALEWILTGDMYSAGEAHRIGVVNGVCAPEELMPTVRKVAETLLSRGPVALKHAMESVVRGGDLPIDEGSELEADLFAQLFRTEDMREGTSAFLEKRAAEFTGR